MIETGTRKRQNFRYGHPATGSQTKSYTRDVGLLPNVTASMTFVPASSEITAANGTFANFAVNQQILVEGTNLNNGYFTVTGLDGTNQAFLVVDGNVKTEGPVTATVRTS